MHTQNITNCKTFAKNISFGLWNFCLLNIVNSFVEENNPIALQLIKFLVMVNNYTLLLVAI